MCVSENDVELTERCTLRSERARGIKFEGKKKSAAQRRQVDIVAHIAMPLNVGHENGGKGGMSS